MTYNPNSDPVMRAGLQAMGAAIRNEVGPGVGFALFVDWRDAHGTSYLANVVRPQVVAALGEWLDKTERREPTLATERGTGPTPLGAKCAELAKSMSEEDIGVVLFLFGEAEGPETAWCSTIPGGRALVEAWVASERKRS
jgi:hypothetical protein